MTLLSRIRRSIIVPALTLIAFAAASIPIPARADIPAPPGPSGPGSPVFGVPESGGQQAAGALASVDASKGVAHSSIPFKLPTARGKVQPALSLEYSSTSGQREAGIGWGLALPSIERHNNSGPPLYRDPETGKALNPANEDHFTFAGQALVPICLVGGSSKSASCASAAPGETMPSWANEWHYFRLEADALFARFFWSPDHATWVVQQKSGETMEFGTAQDDPTGTEGIGNEIDPSVSGSPTFRWRLVRRYDAMGADTNPIYYHWEKLSQSQHLRYLVDIYDTPAAGAAQSGGPISFSSFAHHVHLSWTPDDPVTPATGFMPNPMSAARIWRQVPSFLISRVDVTSATMSDTTRKLVRSYALGYFERGSGASHFQRSLLSSVQMTGACNFSEDGGGALPSNISCDGGTLPATTMTYTGINVSPQGTLSEFGQSHGSEAAFLGSLMDVDGDGLPDAVGMLPTNTLIGIFYFGPYVTFSQSFQQSGFASLTSNLWDEAGSANGPVPSTFEGTAQWVSGAWTSASGQAPGASVLSWDSAAQNYQTFAPQTSHGVGTWQSVAVGTLPPGTGLASNAPASSLATFADIDGDGLLDWIRQDPTTNRVTSFYTAQDPVGQIHPLATALTSEPISPLPPPDGSQAQTIFVDANGDGVPDIVDFGIRVSDMPGGTGVDSRPVVTVLRGHGDATFDAKPGFLLDVLPEAISAGFSAGTTSVFLHDVNGDGLADLIAEDANGKVSVYFSTGRSLVEGPHFTVSVPPSALFPFPAQVTFADMNGSGVDDIVFSWPVISVGTTSGGIQLEESNHSTMKYVDLLGGAPQALLSSISNGLGATTTLEYESSAASFDTISPQVLHLVSSITTTVADPSGMSGGPYHTKYAYSGAVYDYRQRTLEGFDHVQTTRVNAASSHGDEVTDTYFQLAETCQLLGCQERDEQIQVIRGLPTFTSVSDTARHYLFATHNQYLLQPLYMGMDGRQTRHAYPEQTDTWRFDSTAVASGTTNTTLTDVQGIDDTLSVLDGIFPILGVTPPPVTTTREKAYPFPKLEAGSGETSVTSTVHIESTQIQDSQGNVTQSTDMGVVSGAPADKAITYAASFPEPDGDWLWRATKTTTSGGGHSRTYEFQYGSRGNLTEVQGDLSGTAPLNRFHEVAGAMVAPTPISAAADGEKQSLTHVDYDTYGNVTQIRSDGGTKCSGISYDPVFQQLPTSTTKYLAGCKSDQKLTTMQSYNRQFETVTHSTGPDMGVTTREVDLFGHVTHVFLPDPEMPGMPETDACTITSYPIVAGGPFQVIHTQQRDDDGGSAKYRSSWTLVDALGRTAATVASANMKNDKDPRIVSGLVKRDSLGQVVTAYPPFFSSYEATTSSLPKPGSGPSYTFEYDFFGRTEAVQQLDGTTSILVTYHALSQDVWDATDLAGGTPHPVTLTQDGHGRTVKTSQPTGSGGADGHSMDTIVTTTEYLPTGETTRFTRTHAGGERYTRSMTYDSLGRLVLNSEPNTSGSGGEWVYAYDIGGQLVATSDARGCGVNYAYDGLGRVVSEDYSPCLSSQPDYTPPQSNGDGTEALFHYDTPEAGQTKDFGPHPVFLMGKLATLNDRAQHSRYSYDGRGRRVHTAKQVAGPGPSPAMVSQRYSPSWYQTETAYDEANRPIAQTTGADVSGLQGAGVTVGGVTSTSLVSVAYDNRDIPVQVGGSYGALVTNEVHAADGLLTSRQWADGGQTSGVWGYTTNRQPKRAFLSRASVTPTVLLDSSDEDYDPVGNALTLKDNRKQGEWPASAKPVSRSLTYDDLYRLRGVKYSYEGGDEQAPLFGGSDLSPMPLSLPDTRVKHESYDYDWQDNLVSSTDDANAFFTRSVGTEKYGSSSAGPNQVHSVSGQGGKATIRYDAAGNMTSIVEPAAFSDGAGAPSFQLQYTWDEVGRLSSATRADYMGNEETETTTIQYGYDASGQRVSRAVQVANQETTYFLEIFPTLRINNTTWGDVLNQDYDRDATTETAYLAVGGASYGRVINDDSVPLSPTGGSQHVYLQMTDRLGSTSSVVDLASGDLVEQSTYLPYGGGESDYRAPGWDSLRESYRYTGKEDDYQVGLIYFGQRYFSPALGRWASADPLAIQGLSGDPNPYSFAQGSPLRFVDATGLDVTVPTSGSGGYVDPSFDTYTSVLTGPGYGAGLFDGPPATSIYSEVPDITVATDSDDAPSSASTTPLADPEGAFGATSAEQFSAALGGFQNSALAFAATTVEAVGLVLGPSEALAIGPALGAATTALSAPLPPTGGSLHDFDLRDSYRTAQNAANVVAAAAPIGFEGIVERLGVEAAANAVSAYEVGTYDALRARSAVGDALDLHHVGQAHAMEQIVADYSRATGPAIALPQAEHAAIPTLRGAVDVSPRSLLARDIWNLRQYTNTPNSSLQQLIELNKTLYPEAFGP